MKTLIRNHLWLTICFATVITGSVLAAVIGRPDVKVALSGSVERDQQLITLDKAGLLNPGEVLNWTIVAQNHGNAPAHLYKTTGEIPTGTTYLAGSARAAGDVTITYSIDDGKTFEAKPTISQKQPDGSVRKVAAPVTLYTHIRYEWGTPLTEGQQFSASYKVRVK
ncbi:MAG TPA: hypothetical protein VFZ34_14700 [Blastocatellia bacterium]|nr:hypothetical protein [Blastocatellia bacterium]